MISTRDNRLAERAIRKQRSELFKEDGFVASILMSLELELNRDTTNTLATNGERLFYSPEFVNGLQSRSLKAILVHEAYHVFANHPVRMLETMERYPGADNMILNIAADLSINWMIQKAGYALPPDALRNPDIERKSFEQIVGILINESNKQEDNKGKGPKESDDSSEAGDEGEQGEDDGTSDDEEDGEGKPGESEEPTEEGDENGDAEDSSGGDGENQEGEASEEEPEGGGGQGDGPPEESMEEMAERLGYKLPKNFSEVIPSEAETEEEIQSLKEKQAKVVSDAIDIGKMCGSSGDPDRLLVASEQANLAIDWKSRVDEIFASRFGTPSGVDVTRLDRRQWSYGIYANEPIRDSVEDLVIAVDVSSSVSAELANEFLEHVKGIVNTLEVESLHFITFAHRILSYRKIERNQSEIPKTVAMGGGTDFRPIMNLIRKEMIDPTALFIFSDMECGVDNADVPEFPVYWVTETQYSTLHASWWFHVLPEYGEIVYMN